MSRLEIIAYEVGRTEGWTLEPSPSRREWMDQTPYQGANRCLPLLMANQAGWIVRCPCAFKATWTGKSMPDALTIEVQDQPDRYGRQIASIFGSGIISFSLPWLFKTSENVGLIVRGPANSPRSDAVPLDGLVETDWNPATFTMNWKLTKSKTPVWFRKGEPICMLTPFPMDFLEQFIARSAPLHEADPKLQEEFSAWLQTRKEQFASQEAPTGRYRLDYMRGRRADGAQAPNHRTGLKLAKFDP